jgi:arabinofuranosyltransferase
MAVLLLVFNLYCFYGPGSINDDAYISFRYLDNWLGGDGLVFNPGQRVEGYSNLLWIVLLAPLRLLGLPPECASLILAAGFLCLLFLGVYRTTLALTGERSYAVLSLVLAASSPLLARWSLSGLETVCFASFIALANMAMAERAAHSPASSALLGASALTRPDGALYALAAFFSVVFAHGSNHGSDSRPKRGSLLRSALVPALIFASIVILHTGFRLAYYSELFPNTYYAKVSGIDVSLAPQGAGYLIGFLASGGVIYLLLAALSIFYRGLRGWVFYSLVLQILLTALYVVRVGGDYMPFYRFVLPVVPHLCVLGGIGIGALASRFGLRPAVTYLILIVFIAAGTVMTYTSPQMESYRFTLNTNLEREAVARHLKESYPADTLVALNPAGIIPYRTGMPTIDMLGLNDRHIARAKVVQSTTGPLMPGHMKYDGLYVCSREPHIVLTSGGSFFLGSSAEEAAVQAALNSFAGDRDFLNAPDCRDKYSVRHKRVSEGKYIVYYLLDRAKPSGTVYASEPVTAEDYFRRGVNLMGRARLAEARGSFEMANTLDPGNPLVLTNLAYVHFDLREYPPAADLFTLVLKSYPENPEAIFGLALTMEKKGNAEEAARLWRRYITVAPESVWKERARTSLRLLEGSAGIQ